FKLNVKISFLYWMILLVGFSYIGYSLYSLTLLNTSTLVVVALYFGLVELSILTMYGFVLLAKFEINIGEMIMKSLLYGHKHILTTITIISVIGANVWLIIYVHPLFIIVGFGIAGYVISRLVLESVVLKYVDKEELDRYDGE
ncbi:MAG: hypothetical protein PF505_03530, partial [Vallitaleaceae bacterium]|nr:hypothetical protein [Vallitaleaceae bacterium]